MAKSVCCKRQITSTVLTYFVIPRLVWMLEVLKRIRKQGELPAVMLTAQNDGIDHIVGLEIGADDYLSKSCRSRELTSRLNSILRRTRQKGARRKMPDINTVGLRHSPRAEP
jgi:DNA-binding response OmpR family regulator